MGVDFQPARYVGYHRALAGVKIEALEFACEQAAQTFRFMPVPVELKELTRGYKPPPFVPKALLPDLTPPEESKRRLQELFDTLNGKYGTSLNAGGQHG